MGQLNLPDSARIYIDTLVVIYTIEVNPNYWQLVQPLWQKFQAGQIELITSELTLMESLVIPFRQSNANLIDTYEQLLLSSVLQLIPINQIILREAARLRAITPSLKTPDAIHAATAITSGCTQFITNDRQLRTVANLPVVILDEVLAS
ncbi:type II toxin-antitoxin system VapC family toxin [Iningainema tapete]|uniref:Ribonuclease VapC n=1 Tax=Iningainema tapete BLCC-T55 TaxID=2748662 RepID=A0A8J6XJI8_9CYAN|nr:type II toxin-antitoxin system VapC family toxin [Iningainema tapete]MBD2773651.1 type II toxin-antitoxin system VapC family toxin [Iningainema tapete BLCC-T55]